MKESTILFRILLTVQIIGYISIHRSMEWKRVEFYWLLGPSCFVVALDPDRWPNYTSGAPSVVGGSPSKTSMKPLVHCSITIYFASIFSGKGLVESSNNAVCRGCLMVNCGSYRSSFLRRA